MFDKMKDLMEMKKQADRLKRELEDASVEVNAVNGIKIIVSGSQKFKSIDIDESAIQGGNTDKFQQNLLTSIIGLMIKTSGAWFNDD